MCGRFAQYRSMRDYLRELDSEQDAMSGWEGEPIQRYNVAPSTQVQVLHSTGGHLVVAEVRWGWAPNWAAIAWASTSPLAIALSSSVGRGCKCSIRFTWCLRSNSRWHQ